jgi:hypothetical protein
VRLWATEDAFEGKGAGPPCTPGLAPFVPVEEDWECIDEREELDRP